MTGADGFEHVMSWIRGHYFGKYRGKVTSTDDPASRGRLKVRVPSVLADVELWAMPCVPYAGDGVGFYCLPAVDAGVWVEFEAGDPSYPVWSGCFWADGQLPDESNADIKIWKTVKATLRCDDSADEIKLANSSDASLVLASDGTTLAFSETKVELASDGATTSSNESQHVVGTEGVKSTASAGGGVEITATVSINDGAFQVA